MLQFLSGLLNSLSSSWQFFAVGAACFEAMFIIAAKKALDNRHSLPLSAASSMVVALLSLPLLLFSSVPYSLEILLLALLNAIASALAMYYFFKSIHHLDISVAAPMMAINPVILAVLAFALLGEHLSEMQAVGVILVAFGIYILELSLHQGDLLRPLKNLFRSTYMHYIFFSAMLYAIASMMDKIILKQIDVIPFLLLINVFVAIILVLMMYLHDRDWKNTFNSHFRFGGWKMIVVIAGSLLAYRFFIFQAITLTLVSAVMPLRRLSSLIATIVGGELFHEKNLLQKLFAATVMLVGVYFVASGA